ncbi:MAG: ubiquinone/menaquinone biosynthesis C-methylase UbiE [Verrucomicrobiales bacterium]|jgi:ubiquinone/menaquinone biosynthesis C-methylase UbiE
MKLPTTVALAALALALPLAFAQDAATKKQESVKPGINKNFLDPGLQLRDWIGRFEVESREVYHAREDIIKALELKPGMAVADIGAGTGLYMKPFAKAVGDNGKVYAVDISAAFVKGLKDRAKKAKFPQVEVVLCKEDSVELKPESIDLAFVCDTYHHFEFPTSTLASIHRALKPGGRLVIIDFERIEGTSSEWTMGHVRAGKEVFSAEIKAAKFEQVEEVKLDKLKDNYFLIFKKA